MTEDTRRALDIIKPMADELNIRVDADDRLLYCNGQAIGIGCNSTYATVLEFIGYVLVKEYSKWRRLSPKLLSDAKRFWISEEMVKKNTGRRMTQYKAVRSYQRGTTQLNELNDAFENGWEFVRASEFIQEVKDPNRTYFGYIEYILKRETTE